MNSISYRWWRLAAPPLAAWLGACSAQSDAKPYTSKSAPDAGLVVPADAGGSAGPMGAAAAEGGELPRAILPGERQQAGAGGRGTALAGSGGAGSAAAGSVSGAGARAGARAAQAGGAGGSSTSAGAGGVQAAGAGGRAAEPAAGSGGAAGAPAAAVSFGQVYAVLMAGCSCHLTGAAGLDLQSRTLAYASLVDVPSRACTNQKRVVAGAPDASVLVHAIEHTDLGGCGVPQMPIGADKLGASELALIRSWIASGARDD